MAYDARDYPNERWRSHLAFRVLRLVPTISDDLTSQMGVPSSRQGIGSTLEMEDEDAEENIECDTGDISSTPNECDGVTDGGDGSSTPTMDDSHTDTISGPNDASSIAASPAFSSRGGHFGRKKAKTNLQMAKDG